MTPESIRVNGHGEKPIPPFLSPEMYETIGVIAMSLELVSEGETPSADMVRNVIITAASELGIYISYIQKNGRGPAYLCWDGTRVSQEQPPFAWPAPTTTIPDGARPVPEWSAVDQHVFSTLAQALDLPPSDTTAAIEGSLSFFSAHLRMKRRGCAGPFYDEPPHRYQDDQEPGW
jgi:hypothetical protein